MFVPEKLYMVFLLENQKMQVDEKPRITERLKHEADGSGYTREGFTHLFYISSEGGKPTQVTFEKYNHTSYEWNDNSNGFIFSPHYNEDWEYDFKFRVI